MNKTIKNWPLLLYITFFLIGITIRFIHLGADPLSQNEGHLAFQALEGLNNNSVGTIDQSNYYGLTILSFFLTNSSNFVARFWPALVGSLLIFTPLFWRKELGQITTLGLVFTLSIDPVLIHASRTIGSPIFAIFGLFAGLSLLYHKKPSLSGIAFAIAILGGEQIWFGLLVLGLAWGILRLINIRMIDTDIKTKFNLNESGFTKEQIISGILWFAITFLVLGTGFTLFPSGLGDTMTGFILFFQKFFVKSGIAFWQPLLAIVSYQFLPLIIAIWAGIHAWVHKDIVGKWLSLWVIIVFLLVTILPGRRFMDITWIALPLWILSVRFVVNSINWSMKGMWIKTIIASITIISLTYLAIIIRSFVNPEFSQVNASTYIIVPAAILFLLVISVVLVGLGWRFNYSLSGLFSGLLIFFLTITISLGISAVVNKSEGRAELWRVENTLPSSSLIVETIESISDNYLGDRHSAEIFVIDVDKSEIRWALRQFGNVAYYQNFPTGEQPDIVITRANDLDNLVASYRGEKILGQQVPAWDKMQFIDYIKWIVNHKVEYKEESLYLWINADLFPGG